MLPMARFVSSLCLHALECHWTRERKGGWVAGGRAGGEGDSLEETLELLVAKMADT